MRIFAAVNPSLVKRRTPRKHKTKHGFDGELPSSTAMDGKVADSAVLYDRKNNCLINKDLFALAGLVSIAQPEKVSRMPGWHRRKNDRTS